MNFLLPKSLLSLSPALTTTTAVILFGSQGDDSENGYIITLGLSFYFEVSTSRTRIRNKFACKKLLCGNNNNMRTSICVGVGAFLHDQSKPKKT
jgi:hypothetical protein